MCSELVLYDRDSLFTHLKFHHPSHDVKEYYKQFFSNGSGDEGGKGSEQGAKGVKQGSKGVKQGSKGVKNGVKQGAKGVKQEARWAEDPFTSLALKGRTRVMVVSHSELHLAAWPHDSCTEEEQVELEVLDSQGLDVVVA